MPRLARLTLALSLSLSLAPALPGGLAAQDVGGVRLSIGPAYRFRTGAAGIDRRGDLDGVSVAAEWTRRLSGRLGLLVGVEGYSGATVVTELDLPCPATGPCAPPNPSPDGRISGHLYDLRLGMTYGGARVRGAVGVALGYSAGGIEEWGGGGFASLQVRPIRRLEWMTLGVSGLVLSPAPGHTRALLVPTVGVSF